MEKTQLFLPFMVSCILLTNAYAISIPELSRPMAKSLITDSSSAVQNTDSSHKEKNSLTTDESFVLPVVFHIINENPNSVTDQQITDAVKDLNDAFSKSGLYSASKGVDTKISFCLAQKDPYGGSTTGITRTQSYFGSNMAVDIEDHRLKRLIQWDASRYINIWLIAGMHKEISASFSCGQWKRTYEGGYATMPPASGDLDGIVVTGFGVLLAHEMGHYLGLFHTFEGDCNNNNCASDGDQVCDTPPEYLNGSNAYDCTTPVNSCSTDTLSGFKKDMPDLKSDFMDYGIAACQNEFTLGQSNRMHNVIKTQRSTLLQNECNKPCLENSVASFSRNTPYPVPDATITFTNTSVRALHYQWLINNVPVATTLNYSTSFNSVGRYEVTLKAYNNNPDCFASYSDYVTVTCGVTARFYADKQRIASKVPLYPDSIAFTNTSYNATSYKWLIGNDAGMAEKVVSAAKNLTYVFAEPGNYTVRLIATNGSCTDTTETFTVPVADPTQNGVPRLSGAYCSNQTDVVVSIYICNYGYAPIPAGIPVSFYDGDPSQPSSHKIEPTFYLPHAVSGNCCGDSYSHELKVGYEKLNRLYAVFNDSGKAVPVKLPGTKMKEFNYGDNTASVSGFAYHAYITPSISTLEPGDTVQLTAVSTPDYAGNYYWSPAYNLSCNDCMQPNLIADSAELKQAVVTSIHSCYDTAYAEIKVPPYNDFTVSLDDVQCAADNKLHVNCTIYNSFKRAVIPKGLSVSFYNGDPSTSSATLLSKAFFVSDTVNANQASFSLFINNMAPGDLYAVVNDSSASLPVQLPNTPFAEKDYNNNISHISYSPQKIALQPADTTVFRKTSFNYSIITPLVNPSSVKWLPGNNYTLNCSECINPVCTVKDIDSVKMQTLNAYGCLVTGAASVKIVLPDLTITPVKAQCYTNDTSLIYFNVCIANNYDSLPATLPVAFYDDDPAGTNAHLLEPVFYTPAAIADICYIYQHKIQKPSNGHLYARVNDKGNAGNIPVHVLEEANYSNNTLNVMLLPFTVNSKPADTSIMLHESALLQASATGGFLSSAAWRPAQYLSCADCLATIVTPKFTTEYVLKGRNEYFCTDTAHVLIKTYTGGELNLPSAFTPNNDGLNDVFYVLAGKDAVLVKEFSVYDRWGNTVFAVTNVLPNTPAYGWKGDIKGYHAQAGTYVYKIIIAFGNGSVKAYKGTVVLIR